MPPNECKDSKFKLCFTLKQHTPLIHFQANQNGATLRATELKPKLDRFLLTKLGKGDYEKGKEEAKRKGWLIGKGEHPALDYKIKIQSDEKEEIDNFQTKKLGAYFGDYSSILLDKISITITSFQQKILENIDENIFAEFILTTNFGSRQNKGFGSFTVEKANQKKIQVDTIPLLEKHYEVLNKLSSTNPLKEIASFYQDVKSGSKMRRRKSKLMQYFLKKNIRWEKRWIKRKLQEQNETLFQDLKDEYHQKNDFNFNDDENYQYIRSLLGISGNIEFITYSYENKKNEADDLKKQIEKERNRDQKNRLKRKRQRLMKEADSLKIVVSIEHNEPRKEKKIERFASPIFFKVINNDIYILMEKERPLNREILDKVFEFTASYKNGNEKTSLTPVLKTPDLTDRELANMYKEIFKHQPNKKNGSKPKKENIQKHFNNPFANLKDML